MNKIEINIDKFGGSFKLFCPFTNEKLDHDSGSLEIYEGSGEYIFSMCEDCMFFDVGNNSEIEKYWKNRPLEAIEKFVQNHKDKNILVIEVTFKDEKYYFGFLNEKNIELSEGEIEKRFIKA
ncbi:hypothetical protein AFAEC_1743 [Aliarcobacter faecis]|uniref:hypothetical protein n=1 Tax=Aliarcobacter faecis TaxID=1564138 RepID=UPI00047EC105|nr:hypothetical protein [Aliarcobacter faecis]QKF73899.1 hypothetical protein AFAEC_1743 [Aliarcobacter faecis]